MTTTSCLVKIKLPLIVKKMLWAQRLWLKVGSVRRVIIPPTLGYGAEAQNGIPANSVLVFDIQVISVQ